MIKIKFTEWISSFFGGDKTTISLTETQIAGEVQSLEIEMFAIATAIDLISNSISKCSFKTYLKGNEYKGDEFYSWNVQPNINQNSSQFMQKLITELLYNNECLVLDINGQFVIADSFYQSEYAVVENSFNSVVSGTMSFNKTFRMSEVMYFKLGNNDIRRLLSKVIVGYNNLLNMSIGKYKRSGGRKGILDIDATASKDEKFQENLEILMTKRFKTYFEAENAVLPLQKGYVYKEQGGEGSKKSTSEIVDINAVTKEIFERVAQAFKIPPSLLRGDIADISNITDNFLTFCIDPICCMISEEVNRKRYPKNDFLEGSYTRVDTSSIKHVDIFSISTAFDKLIASGGYSIDELRIKCGDVALNTDFSKQHFITKNYQKIETLGVETTVTK